jgi:hypothetical protein
MDNVLDFEVTPDCSPELQALAYVLKKYGPVVAKNEDFDDVIGSTVRVSIPDGADGNSGAAEVTLELVEE